jgi:RNA polymerase sigma-70 factor (ECF subfamily)
MQPGNIQDLYSLYGDELRRYISKRLQSSDSADDLTHEAFIRLLRRQPGEDVDNPRAYLYTIAGNLVADHLRKSRKQPFVDEDDGQNIMDGSPGPERSTMAKDELRRLREAVDKLPPRQREILLLHKFEDLSYIEIAEKLNISKNTVMVHMMRALKSCRDHMAKD